MSTEQERAAFETWAQNSFELHRHSAGEYSSNFTQAAWAAWQAGRSAMQSPGRVDIIHAEVKKLLVDSQDAAGHLHRPLDKSERYTIPLYASSPPDEPAEVPSDAELIQFATDEQFLLFCDKDEFLDIARTVLQRYSARRIEGNHD